MFIKHHNHDIIGNSLLKISKHYVLYYYGIVDMKYFQTDRTIYCKN